VVELEYLQRCAADYENGELRSVLEEFNNYYLRETERLIPIQFANASWIAGPQLQSRQVQDEIAATTRNIHLEVLRNFRLNALGLGEESNLPATPPLSDTNGSPRPAFSSFLSHHSQQLSGSETDYFTGFWESEQPHLEFVQTAAVPGLNFQPGYLNLPDPGPPAYGSWSALQMPGDDVPSSTATVRVQCIHHTAAGGEDGMEPWCDNCHGGGTG
jgi:hypothetical protein